MSFDFDAGGLKAILADPTGFGEDVAFGYKKFRGILSREQRFENDGAGVQSPVVVTTLTVQASKLPAGIESDSVLTIAGVAYRVRRIGEVDSAGQIDLLVVERDP